MILKWQYISSLFIVICLNPLYCLGNVYKDPYRTLDPGNWRTIEMLAEDHPYLVALLSGMKDYLCTGSIINKNCIITSGNCVILAPKYVAVGTAIYSKRVNSNTLFNVASTVVHADYVFELQTGDPNVTKMHSNIGLVFVDRPFLEVFINVAELGNYFATELQNKKLTVIGYGGLGPPNLLGLQYQFYQQTPCINPKWYYCICGVEFNIISKTYISEFGAGAPVLLNSLLVGITAAPCGALSMRSVGLKYNIFSIVGPYSGWIQKWTSNSTKRKAVLHSAYNSVNMERVISLKSLCLFMIISKIFF